MSITPAVIYARYSSSGQREESIKEFNMEGKKFDANALMDMMNISGERRQMYINGTMRDAICASAEERRNYMNYIASLSVNAEDQVMKWYMENASDNSEES